MSWLLHPASISAFLHLVIVSLVIVRVVMKRPATGVALAWLLIVVAIPAFGVTLYLLLGERRIGQRRARRLETLRTDADQVVEAFGLGRLTEVDWDRHSETVRGMNHLGKVLGGASTFAGSQVQMFTNTPDALRAIAADVQGARCSVLMEFYIWNAGGTADEVLNAVMEAARRGVSCRLLVDDMGSHSWWRGPQPRQLREAGVELLPALPVGLIRSVFSRTDLRLHRKIVVVDGEIAWTGSMNMVDPSFFSQAKVFGEWVDASLRIEGSAVAPLAATMIGDWILETGQPLKKLIHSVNLHALEPVGTMDIQVVSTGPGQTADALLQMLNAQIHGATEELILTTPYFVPDESLLRAIRGAAGRGVKVSIIVPEKVNSFLTRHASRSYYDDLFEMGVEIYQYQAGLLHTKSIVADRCISMFGTVNLDMRSLWLNYEVSLFVYDKDFSHSLRELQLEYLKCCERIDPEVWSQRSFGARLIQNGMRLLSPLL